MIDCLRIQQNTVVFPQVDMPSSGYTVGINHRHFENRVPFFDTLSSQILHQVHQHAYIQYIYLVLYGRTHYLSLRSQVSLNVIVLAARHYISKNAKSKAF